MKQFIFILLTLSLIISGTSGTSGLALADGKIWGKNAIYLDDSQKIRVTYKVRSGCVAHTAIVGADRVVDSDVPMSGLITLTGFIVSVEDQADGKPSMSGDCNKTSQIEGLVDVKADVNNAPQVQDPLDLTFKK